jgi:hypothetical protein
MVFLRVLSIQPDRQLILVRSALKCEVFGEAIQSRARGRVIVRVGPSDSGLRTTRESPQPTDFTSLPGLQSRNALLTRR